MPCEPDGSSLWLVAHHNLMLPLSVGKVGWDCCGIASPPYHCLLHPGGAQAARFDYKAHPQTPSCFPHRSFDAQVSAYDHNPKASPEPNRAPKPAPSRFSRVQAPQHMELLLLCLVLWCLPKTRAASGGKGEEEQLSLGSRAMKPGQKHHWELTGLPWVAIVRRHSCSDRR